MKIKDLLKLVVRLFRRTLVPPGRWDSTKEEILAIGKKYCFTGEKIQWKGRTLHRIQALRSFGKVRKGDLGGWIEKEYNLDPYYSGIAWAWDESKIYDWAQLDGITSGNVELRDNAKILSYGTVMGNCVVSDYAQIYGTLFGYVWAAGEANIGRGAWVSGYAFITGRVSGSTLLWSRLFGDPNAGHHFSNGSIEIILWRKTWVRGTTWIQEKKEISYGKNLLNELIRRNISIWEASRALGISVKTLDKIEHDTLQVDYPLYKKINLYLLPEDLGVRR